ncbi:MAG: biotin--[acetyl-CoA-carboxylase] ligase [candidate division KSB1 bacterium]|nr:biotin--[acetyl-CoA-carboxylase] ligase [candidate division KSB1 bacterium]
MKTNIIHLETTDSTNEYLKRHQNSLASGTLVCAEQQSRGKGRRGHEWASMRGKSLLFSMLIKPHITFQPATNLSICPAIALIRALAQLNIKAAVKWPNDIVMNNRKIAGILVESSWQSDTIKTVVIGVGINVSQDQNDFSGLSEAGSILTQTGRYIDRDELFESICAEFYRFSSYFEMRKPFHELIQEWLSYCDHIDSPIHLMDGSGKRGGIFRSINEQGEAIVETPDKQHHIFENSKYKMRKTNAVDD